MDDAATEQPPTTTTAEAGSTSSTQTAGQQSADPLAELGERILAELGEERTNNTLIRWLSHHTARLMQAADDAAHAGDVSAPARAEEARTAILQLWQARSAWPEGWPPPRAAALAKTLAGIPEVSADTWPGQSFPARLSAVHEVILAAFTDEAAASAPDGNEEDWLNASGEHLTDAETVILRRAADAPQHSEALGELATLIEQFNAPKPGEPSGPPADDVMQHPLVRLADAYRKIIINHVARTAPPAQADRAANPSHGTDEAAEQTNVGEPTADDGGNP
ncbi:hypothetical protein [Streptomyces europaeiscabiei]|uniref:hypothetical protein n=1 Tax=Streptomyces europaeiscabiei TaxID=146819 RepID=UPI0029A255DF|nr:hypothetical protein [Streptomyces europaeiscabiei]MDX3585763.1 hypothetical protein [Streptomyces europaeiscabiei]MDX3635959.1 hypothetical protein [Streptomyces europaeiscabiei]MDX3654035.1 hypothetical protein [Streptomyces europaeiscabiei]